MQISNILFLALQGCSGAVAGYITNKYAVNMLFNEYEPFKFNGKEILPYKFGGVIKNNKEKFIEELSELVERDIINGSTIKNKLSEPEFLDSIYNLSNTFFKENLMEAFENTKVKDIAGLDNTNSEIFKFIDTNLECGISEVIDSLSENIKFQNMLSVNQLNNIVDNIYNLIKDQIYNSGNISEVINKIYDDNCSITTSELLTQESVNKISKNIEDYLNSTIDDYFNNEPNLIELYSKIIDIIEVNDIFVKLQESLNNKKLKSIVNDDEIKQLTEIIYKKFNNHLLCENGAKEVESFVKEIIAILKTLDISIYDLISEAGIEKVIEFINNKMPSLLVYVSTWITTNQKEIYELIEKSVGEAIENLDDKIKQVIEAKVNAILYDDNNENSNIISKIIEYLKEYSNDDVFINKLNDNIKTYFKNVKVSKIVMMLEKSDIITDESLHIISEKLIDEFDSNGMQLIEILVNSFLDKSISSILNINLISVFDNKIKNIIYNKILENKDNIKIYLINKSSNALYNKIDEIIHKSIKDIFPKGKLVENLKLVDILDNNEQNIKNLLKRELNNIISNVDIEKFLQKNYDFIYTTLHVELENMQNSIKEKYNHYEINEIFKNIYKKNDLNAYAQSELLKYIEDNSDSILKGKVKKIVYNNLIKFNEDEICDLAQKFMGNELKPLSIFGGALGFICGLIFGALSTQLNITGFYGSFREGLTSVLLMGGIGVLTNIIAIAMLFRPYKKNKFLAKIPLLKVFSLGYIPAHKDNLSEGIGGVIDNELLNSAKIKKVLYENKESSNRILASYFEKNNYSVLLDFLTRKKENYSQYISKSIIKYLKTNEKGISRKISNKISKTPVEIILSKMSEDNIVGGLKKHKNALKDKIVIYLENKNKSESKIKEVIPNELIQKSEEYVINSIKSLVYEESKKTIQSTEFDEFLHSQIDKTIISIKEKSIGDLLTEVDIEKVKSTSTQKIEQFVFGDFRSILNNKIQDILSIVLDSNMKIETILNGSIKSILDNNIDSITKILLNKVNIKLLENKEIIGIKVNNEICSSLNFFEKMAFNFASGDKIVNNAVNIAINKELPSLMDLKFEDIKYTLQDALEEELYAVSIKDINIKPYEINTNIFVNCLFGSLNNNSKFKESIQNKANIYLDTILYQKINESILPLDFNTLCERFKDEINIIKSNIIINIEKNEPIINEYVSDVLNNKLFKVFESITIKDITKSIDSKDLSYTSDYIISSLYDNVEVIKIISENLCVFINDKLCKLNLGDILDSKILEKDILLYSNNIFNDNNVLQMIEDSVTKVYNNALLCKLDFIDDETKKYLNYKITNSISECFAANIDSIIKSLNLKEVTKEQINIMDPKEIYDLFQSFAGEYFKKLYAYGSLGCIFGINIYLPIVWAIKDCMGFSHIKDINEENSLTTE